MHSPHLLQLAGVRPGQVSGHGEEFEVAGYLQGESSPPQALPKARGWWVGAVEAHHWHLTKGSREL